MLGRKVKLDFAVLTGHLYTSIVQPGFKSLTIQARHRLTVSDKPKYSTTLGAFRNVYAKYFLDRREEKE